MIGCPKCAGPEARVLDSRQTTDGIRRRRECSSCGHRWSTMEIDKERWDRAKRLLDHRSRGGRISMAKKRGFEIPDEHRAEYRRLRRNKNLTPREAGQVLGLI